MRSLAALRATDSRRRAGDGHIDSDDAPARVPGAARMTDPPRIQGDLQAQLMAVMWRIGQGTVEQVRDALPARYRGAYTTVQTVLNRLSERGMLERERRGQVMVYTPRLTEGEYLSQSIRQTLAGASTDARQVALAQLMGELDEGELDEIRRRAAELATKRRPSPPKP